MHTHAYTLHHTYMHACMLTIHASIAALHAWFEVRAVYRSAAFPVDQHDFLRIHEHLVKMPLIVLHSCIPAQAFNPKTWTLNPELKPLNPEHPKQFNPPKSLRQPGSISLSRGNGCGTEFTNTETEMLACMDLVGSGGRVLGFRGQLES